MSKTFKIITLTVVVLVTMLTMDWFSININKKPIFAISSDGYYKGLLYDTYTCEDMYTSKVVSKFNSFSCKLDIEETNNYDMKLMSNKSEDTEDTEELEPVIGNAKDYDIYYYGFEEMYLNDENNNNYEVMDSLIKEEKTLDNVINDGNFEIKVDNITRIYENDGYTLIKCNEVKEDSVNKNLYIASNDTLESLEKIGFCN